MRHNNSGFTLIEIAIVLVIIGLLLGGVLKGQELITQAKIKNVINDFNGVATAVYAYQDRYKSLPGDDPSAGTRWAATGAAGTSGSGSGALIGTYSTATAAKGTNETPWFWQDLRLAGLISGDPTSTANPLNAVGGIVGAQSSTGGLLGFSTSTLIVCSGSLPAKIAESVDAQLDDGKPNSGSVRAMVETAPPAATALTAGGVAAAYVDDGKNLYVVCKSI